MVTLNHIENIIYNKLLLDSVELDQYNERCESCVRDFISGEFLYFHRY